MNGRRTVKFKIDSGANVTFLSGEICKVFQIMSLGIKQRLFHIVQDETRIAFNTLLQEIRCTEMQFKSNRYTIEVIHSVSVLVVELN